MSLIYKIFKLKTKPWIKYWIYNQEKAPTPILPTEYQQVDYIESSGTQYINTGFKPTGDTSTIIDSIYTPLENSSTSIFGCQNYQAPAYINVYNFGNQTSSTYNYINKYNTLVNNYTATAEFYTGRKLYKLLKNKAYVDNTLINEFNYADFTCTYNAFLFAQNYNGVVNGLATMKLYSCKIYNNDTLVRNFIPCYRKSDEKVGLFDLVTQNFFTNQGTGDFTYGGAIIPKQYQRVEYIESTGTQYIDTGFKPNNYTKYDLKVSSNSLAVQYLVSSQINNKRNNIYIGLNSKISAGYGTAYFNADIIIQKEEIYNLVLDKNLFYINNNLVKTFNQELFSNNLNTYLFVQNSSGTLSNYAYAKLYSCKIYDSGSLLRNFVPCYRKSDNVVGLYDLVNNVFYTNAGTGDFTYGGEV